MNNTPKFALMFGRIISQIKTAPKGHRAVFNANLCTKKQGKLWYGDLDLDAERDKAALIEYATVLNEPLFVLREMDARFTTDGNPVFENYVAVVTSEGIGFNPSPQYY